MAFKIFLSPPHMGGEEIKFVQDAFDTNWIAPYGPYITAFENEMRDYIGVEGALALAIYKSAAEGRPVKLPLESCSTMDFAGRFGR